MSRVPKDLSSSVPDLATENVTRRKRGHSDELTETLEQFSKKIMATLNEWKLEFTQEISGVTDSLNKLNETTNELKSELNQIRGEYVTIKKSVVDLNEKQKILREDISNLQKSMQFHSDDQDELKKRIELYSKEVESINNINKELSEIKMQNEKLKSEINQREQRDRLLNIEIVGVPEYKEEDLYGILMQLGKHTSIDITRDDIIHINRVSPLSRLQGRPKNIVAKLRTRQLKDNLISRSKKCRLTSADLRLPGGVTPVFVNEHLTTYNKNLLKKTKELASFKKYQFVWTKNCRIYVRKAVTLPAVQIVGEEDLKKIL